jgi:hypothetical protein
MVSIISREDALHPVIDRPTDPDLEWVRKPVALRDSNATKMNDSIMDVHSRTVALQPHPRAMSLIDVFCLSFFMSAELSFPEDLKK